MRETIALALLCLVITLASLGAVVATLLRGELFTMDGLLLAAICLTLATIFFFFLVWLISASSLREKFRRRSRSEETRSKE
ncbi:MAG: hypothetical protein ACE5IP_05930 [Terriglobia bacterium]